MKLTMPEQMTAYCEMNMSCTRMFEQLL